MSAQNNSPFLPLPLNLDLDWSFLAPAAAQEGTRMLLQAQIEWIARVGISCAPVAEITESRPIEPLP